MMSSSNPISTCESHMPDNLFDVSEKVVIVTGASRGIGRAVAEGFLAHGARVVLSARSESLLEQAAGYDADRAIAVRADMADAEDGSEVSGFLGRGRAEAEERVGHKLPGGSEDEEDTAFQKRVIIRYCEHPKHSHQIHSEYWEPSN